MFGMKKKMFDFYLAGGMRGYKDLNKPLFLLVAGLMRRKGFSVWNPGEKESYIHSSFAECMINDLNAVINECRNIALLPGWKDSLGANSEALVAFVAGKDAVEVILNDDKTSFELRPFVLTHYRLPYQTGKTRQYNPHVEDDE